jgi:hypothetical protein
LESHVTIIDEQPATHSGTTTPLAANTRQRDTTKRERAHAPIAALGFAVGNGQVRDINRGA